MLTFVKDISLVVGAIAGWLASQVNAFIGACIVLTVLRPLIKRA